MTQNKPGRIDTPPSDWLDDYVLWRSDECPEVERVVHLGQLGSVRATTGIIRNETDYQSSSPHSTREAIGSRMVLHLEDCR